MMIKNILLVGAGGFIGSILRYSVWLATKPTGFPLNTLLVNIAGSFFIGLLMGMGLRNEQLGAQWKLFLATGICGGFTTFSAFSLENMGLLQQGRYAAALLYISASILLGIGATFLGFKLSVTAFQ